MNVEHIQTRKVKKLLLEAAFTGEIIEIMDDCTGEIYESEVVAVNDNEVQLIIYMPVTWNINKFIGTNND
ncbi:hypothetical protein RDV78_05195 [Bacillota bacterium LX-D]|nr:hypothetical protein [Bacillota bacterium LX-D]